MEDGFSKEEWKMVVETKKIPRSENQALLTIAVAAVPVFTIKNHSEGRLTTWSLRTRSARWRRATS